MYTLFESAHAHAKTAEKLIEPEAHFLNSEPGAVPIFVNLLLQSLEISLKAFAIESELFKPDELRSKKFKNGHGVEEIANAINERMCPFDVISLTLPKHGFAFSNDIVREMIFGQNFGPTRVSYSSRKLTYTEFEKGELQIIEDSKNWVFAVLSFAKNIESAVQLYKKG